MGPITLPASRMQNDSRTADETNETPIPAWQAFSLQSLGELLSLIWSRVPPLFRGPPFCLQVSMVEILQNIDFSSEQGLENNNYSVNQKQKRAILVG